SCCSSRVIAHPQLRPLTYRALVSQPQNRRESAGAALDDRATCAAMRTEFHPQDLDGGLDGSCWKGVACQSLRRSALLQDDEEFLDEADTKIVFVRKPT